MSRLIIFDMDGTVVNSGKMLSKTINAVRADFDLPALEQKAMLHALNDPEIDSARFFYEIDAFTPKHTQLFESYYHRYCIEEIELYAGMQELLKQYHQTYDLAIATNAHTAFAKKILSHLQVENYFKSIIGADLVRNPKPSPDMVELTLQRFSHAKEHSILIGDSPKDKQAAQAAGIRHTIVGWGFTEHKEQTHFVHSVDDLAKRLQNI